jgi:ribonuclease VapC
MGDAAVTVVVDTSALMAILLKEDSAASAAAKIAEADTVAISAGTLAEALIVAGGRGVRKQMAELIDKLGFEIATVSRPMAESAADAYERWGKGRHKAALNFGDCLAYALAKERGAPLLFVGVDFSKTDIQSAL